MDQNRVIYLLGLEGWSSKTGPRLPFAFVPVTNPALDIDLQSDGGHHVPDVRFGHHWIRHRNGVHPRLHGEGGADLGNFYRDLIRFTSPP
jgi:hypothetical protein